MRLSIWEKSEARYIAVGLWNTFFSMAIFVVIQIAFSDVLTVTEGLTAAFVLGVIQSFATQKKYVWRSSEKVSDEFPKFLFISTLQYLSNLLLLRIFTLRFNMNVILSQILIASALILITYVVLRFWVFTVESANPDQDQTHPMARE
jgi:putative flippase GtrA